MDSVVINTLSMPDIRPGRRQGNTTRQVDFAIQKLFEGHEVMVRDHHQSPESSTRLLHLIVKRLTVEHNIRPDSVLIDKSNLIIQFL